MWDYSKLKGRLAEKGYTQGDAAHIIGITQGTFSLKINNHTEFNLKEIKKLADALDIPEEKISSYFFCEKS